MADGNTEDTACRTALYRHFDAGGALLYVGVSLSPAYRLSQHRDASPWFERLANVTIEWFDSRPEALAAERAAIKAECPECNIIHQVRPQSAVAKWIDGLREEAKADLVRRVVSIESTYSVVGAAKALGVPESYVRLALAAGDLPYYAASGVVITGWAVLGYMEALEAGAVKVRRPERLPDGTQRRSPTNAWLCENHGSTSIEAWHALVDSQTTADELADRL